MNKLSNAKLKAYDEALFDYRFIDNKIALRKLELQTDVNTEIDTNIGGGKANFVSKVTEDVVARWDSDRDLKGLINFKEAVIATLQILDKELTDIFYLRWGDGSTNTWEEIAYIKHLSRKSVYRKRERILEIFSKKVGI
ncbi:transcriptional regulator [Streptococcus uberis]|uniref:transcriptional regulator n=1 Tax=Streptococcus uberis TaxID=1349 RepID=UPI0020BDA0BF|nr:transcriptional regulator [Streptococcus uberis]